VARRIKPMKNPNDSIRNRTCNFLACSAVPQPPVLYTPLSHILTKKNLSSVTNRNVTPPGYLIISTQTSTQSRLQCAFVYTPKSCFGFVGLYTNEHFGIVYKPHINCMYIYKSLQYVSQPQPPAYLCYLCLQKPQSLVPSMLAKSINGTSWNTNFWPTNKERTIHTYCLQLYVLTANNSTF
jgi:hypothetical protein